jgi:nitronate monooxygenase
MRSFYAVRSAMKLRRAAVRPNATPDYWQAGKSVAGIDSVESVAHVLGEFAAAAGLVRG